MSSHRRKMTARIVPLRDEAAGDARVAGTPDERLALLSVLSRRMWALGGQPVRSYTRRTMPVKVSRLSDQ